jgi:hypothetical protein
MLACSAVLVLLRVVACYIPPEQYRHEQITSMQAAFSRFGSQGLEGTVLRQDLPNFLQFVVASMNSRVLPNDQVLSRSVDLTKQLMAQLPADVSLLPRALTKPQGCEWRLL